MDDTKLLVPLKDLSTAKNIVQPAINFISAWVAENGLDFNSQARIVLGHFPIMALRKLTWHYQAS